MSSQDWEQAISEAPRELLPLYVEALDWAVENRDDLLAVEVYGKASETVRSHPRIELAWVKHLL